MLNGRKLRGFAVGMLTAGLFTMTAFASAIDVNMGGIRVFLRGKEQTLTDANGAKVEPILYDGTTYVPLRAMSGLMNKKVQWEAAEKAVYIGERLYNAIPLDELPESKIDRADMKIKTNTTITRKDATIACANLLRGDGTNIYILDGKYAALRAKAAYSFTEIQHDNYEGTIRFYSVEDDGSETLIDEYTVALADDPIDISVNLFGVDNLKISSNVSLYDISLVGR